VAAVDQATLAALELALQFVHHGVESGHRVARHGAGTDHVAGAATDEGDFAHLALSDPTMGLFDKPDLGSLDGIEVAVEVTNLLVDGVPQRFGDLDVSVADGDIHARTSLPAGSYSIVLDSGVADLVFVPTLA
jgi:hypothetical protein